LRGGVELEHQAIAPACEHTFVPIEATILHADLDAFYASVEQRDDPSLRGRPMYVGPGVVLAASYEARAFGLRSGMGAGKARRLCPQAVGVEARFDAYVEASDAVFAVFEETAPVVEKLSIDEAFLDVAGLAPDEPEVHGLLALMEIQASRLRARTGPAGEPILLLDQDRGRWDRLLIGRGLAALDRAERLGGALGPYALQGAIAACHARAATPDQTDWKRIAALYDALAQLEPSPVVELNRAVALGMAFGPAAGLELVDELVVDKALEGYHLLPSVRGDLLAKLGRDEEARAELARAAALTGNERECELLLRRAAEIASPRS
jgi:predicted RNA polymerase sigma factor